MFECSQRPEEREKEPSEKERPRTSFLIHCTGHVGLTDVRSRVDEMCVLEGQKRKERGSENGQGVQFCISLVALSFLRQEWFTHVYTCLHMFTLIFDSWNWNEKVRASSVSSGDLACKLAAG